MNKTVLALMSLVPAAALAQTPAAGKQPAAGTGTAAAKAPVAAPVKAPPPPAPAAAPPEIKATVDAFKGNWKFDTNMSATGIPGMEKPFAGKLTMNCKEAAGKTAVICDGKSKTPMGPYDATFVISYDPYMKAVHFFGVTSMNEVHDHICKWSGYDLTCTALKGGMGPAGDEITEDLTMKFEAAPTCKPKEGTDAMVSCPPKTVTFTSTSKMTKGGGTMTFEGKGKR